MKQVLMVTGFVIGVLLVTILVCATASSPTNKDFNAVVQTLIVLTKRLEIVENKLGVVVEDQDRIRFVQSPVH